MDIKFKKNLKSPLALYIKLYCKRKGDSGSKYYNHSLVEATKSWLSLTRDEKLQFFDKLKECQTKLNYRLGDYLKNGEPYVKKKNTKRSQQQICYGVETDVKDSIANENSCENHADNSSTQKESTDPASPRADCSQTEIRQIFTEMESLEDEPYRETTCQIHNEPQLSEPDPPNIKNGKELFELVRAMDENNKTTWTSLSPAKKGRYQRAVLKLKKDYLQKYTTYLKSLSAEELFFYHNKHMNT